MPDLDRDLPFFLVTVLKNSSCAVNRLSNDILVTVSALADRVSELEHRVRLLEKAMRAPEKETILKGEDRELFEQIDKLRGAREQQYVCWAHPTPRSKLLFASKRSDSSFSNDLTLSGGVQPWTRLLH